MKPMGEPRIVFVTRKWAPAVGGMETYSHKLVEALCEIEPVEAIALPGRESGMPPSGWSLLLFPLTVLRRFAARGTAPEVLHLGDMALWPLAVPMPRSTRVFLSAHGTDVAYHRRGGLKGRLYGAYLRFGARWLRRAAVIANSQATREVAAETGWCDVRVVTLATEAHGPLDAPASDRAILFAGRLVERKGCGWFVREVLPRLPATLRLKVAGPEWIGSEAQALADDRVEYLGSLGPAELAGAYAQALCVVVPNIEVASGEFEGFGLVAPEAAAAGGVVLAADHGGLRDAVIDGETGFLVPAGDAAAWAARISEIAAWDPARRRAFVQAAQATAREHYSWERVARETLAVYGLDPR